MVLNYSALIDLKGNSSIEAIRCVIGDGNVYVLNVLVAMDGQTVDLTGHTARITFVKPDGNVVFQDMIIDDPLIGSLHCVLENQAYAVEGTIKAEIELYSPDTGRLTTATFTLTSRKGLLDDGAVESTSEFTALDSALQAVGSFDEIKTEIVDARGAYSTLNEKIGDLSLLSTNAKDSVVNALNEVFNDVNSGKTSIYGAIVDKGVTPSSQTFSDLTTAISQISTEGGGTVEGTAKARDILEGKTATVPRGVITGTMPKNSAITEVAITDVYNFIGDLTILIPKGAYVDTSYEDIEHPLIKILNTNILPENIKAGTSIFGISGSSTVVDTSDGTATTADIAKDKTAYVNGQKITGTAETGDTAVGTHILETTITVSTGNKLSGDIIGVPFLPISMYFNTSDFTNAGYAHCNFTGTCAVSRTYHRDFQSMCEYQSSSSNTISGMISPHEHNDIEYPFKATKQSDGTYNVHFDFSDDFTVFTSITTAVQYSFKLIG